MGQETFSAGQDCRYIAGQPAFPAPGPPHGNSTLLSLHPLKYPIQFKAFLGKHYPFHEEHWSRGSIFRQLIPTQCNMCGNTDSRVCGCSKPGVSQELGVQSGQIAISRQDLREANFADRKKGRQRGARQKGQHKPRPGDE